MAPGRPLNLTVDDVGATWAILCWQMPADTGRPGIARYTVLATNIEDNSTVSASTTDGGIVRELNLTDLLPGVDYEFRVQAVASNGGVENVGVFSRPVVANTSVTGT